MAAITSIRSVTTYESNRPNNNLTKAGYSLRIWYACLILVSIDTVLNTPTSRRRNRSSLPAHRHLRLTDLRRPQTPSPRLVMALFSARRVVCLFLSLLLAAFAVVGSCSLSSLAFAFLPLRCPGRLEGPRYRSTRQLHLPSNVPFH